MISSLPPMDSLLSSSWQHRCLVGLTSIVVSCMVTRALTWLRFEKALASKAAERQTPSLPYSVPIVGHAFSMALNIIGLNRHIAYQYRDLPIRLRVFMTNIYVVTGPEYINSIWKQSSLLQSEIYRQLVVWNMFGMPKEAANFYLSDDSGSTSTPAPNSTVDPTQRVKYLTHYLLVKLLTGPGLNGFAERFATNLAEQLTAKEEIVTQWSDLPDIFIFVRDDLFKATARAIHGEGQLKFSPTLCADFWEFDSRISSLAKRFPRWMVPSAYIARDKCLETIKAWHRPILNRLLDGPTDKQFEKIDTTEFTESRLNMWSKMPLMSPLGMASEDLGLLWGANANSVPSAFWLVYETFRDPSLLARVRKDVGDCLITRSSASPIFDTPRLCSKPLLQSMYMEVLRYYVSTSIIRSPEHASIKLGPWIIPRKALIMVPSFVVHRNQTLWSTGTDASISVETFWPDRFLRYPGSSYSPIVDKTETPSLQPKDADEPLFLSKNLTGYFMPYGGGHSECPGRHFAKQEILTTLAIMVTLFDIEVSEPGDRKVEPNMDGFGMGALKPKDRIPARIRKRAT